MARTGTARRLQHAESATVDARTPLRVLFIIDSLFAGGGAELSLLRLVRYFEAHGLRCWVVTFRADPSRSFLDQFPCPVEYWHLDSAFSLATVRVALRLRRLVCDNHIDVVHTFFANADLWAGWIAKMSGARALVSGRRDMGILRRRRDSILYRLLGGGFDQIQTVSEAVRQYTIETDGVDPSRVVTVFNGIETLTTPIVEAASQDGADSLAGPIVTCVANWRRVKGIDVFVRAAAIVGARIPNVRFVVAGDLGEAFDAGAYAREVYGIIDQLGASEWVRVLGPSTHVHALLKGTTVFVSPSRSEGLSNALLEAMSLGCPCVATAVGGSPEIVEESVTGFLVPPDDPEAIASRILVLLEDEGLRARMGTAGRRRVLADFTIEAVTERVIGGYRRVLRNGLAR